MIRTSRRIQFGSQKSENASDQLSCVTGGIDGIGQSLPWTSFPLTTGSFSSVSQAYDRDGRFSAAVSPKQFSYSFAIRTNVGR